MFKELLNKDVVRMHQIANDLKVSLLDAFQFIEVRTNQDNFCLKKNGLSDISVYVKSNNITINIFGSLSNKSIESLKKKLNLKWGYYTRDYGMVNFSIETKDLSSDLIQDMVKILEGMRYHPKVNGNARYF